MFCSHKIHHTTKIATYNKLTDIETKAKSSAVSSANTAADRQNGNYGNALKLAHARAAEINRNP
jgi:hypothetical protein